MRRDLRRSLSLRRFGVHLAIVPATVAGTGLPGTAAPRGAVNTTFTVLLPAIQAGAGTS